MTFDEILRGTAKPEHQVVNGQLVRIDGKPVDLTMLNGCKVTITDFKTIQALVSDANMLHNWAS